MVDYLPIFVIIKALATVGFFLISNYAPTERKHIPVYIKNDYIYWLGSILLSYLSGYIVCLLMILTPK